MRQPRVTLMQYTCTCIRCSPSMGVVENVIEINLVKLLEATQTGYNWVAVPDPKKSSQRYLLLTAGKLHRY